VADGIAPPILQPLRGTKREASVEAHESEERKDAAESDKDDEALRELDALKVRTFLVICPHRL